MRENMLMNFETVITKYIKVVAAGLKCKKDTNYFGVM